MGCTYPWGPTAALLLQLPFIHSILRTSELSEAPGVLACRSHTSAGVAQRFSPNIQFTIPWEWLGVADPHGSSRISLNLYRNVPFPKSITACSRRQCDFYLSALPCRFVAHALGQADFKLRLHCSSQSPACTEETEPWWSWHFCSTQALFPRGSQAFRLPGPQDRLPQMNREMGNLPEAGCAYPSLPEPHCSSPCQGSLQCNINNSLLAKK